VPDVETQRMASEPVPVPKYFRVKETLLANIASGAWPPGAQIASEPELCREFGVSRTTVRKAVSDLVHDGRLSVVQGKGTFVAGAKIEARFVQRAFGIHEDMERRGIRLSTRLLRAEVIAPPPEVARRLHLRAADPAHLIVRLRSVGDEPVLVSTTYLPRSLCPGLTDEEVRSGSLYRLLREKYGLWIGHGERRLEAVAAGPKEARLLDVALGSPLLMLESVAYRDDGQPFEYSVALQRGDRIAVELDFLPSGDDQTSRLDDLPSVTAGPETRAAALIDATLSETRPR
jgi:GntR family transcriptional regulator